MSMFQLYSQGYPHCAESQVAFPHTNTTLSPAKPEHATGKTSRHIVLPDNGRMHVPWAVVTARPTIFIQGNQGKTSFSTSGVISTSVWTHHCKGSSPTSAQAEEYHLGTASKDTSNRSTIILHVSILKPSDLISWPVKKEQKDYQCMLYHSTLLNSSWAL